MDYLAAFHTDLLSVTTVGHTPSRNSTLSSFSISRDSQLKVSSKCPINFSPTISTETSSPFILHVTRFTIESFLKVSNQLFPNFIHRNVLSLHQLCQRRNSSTLNAAGNNLIKPGHVCGAIEGQTMACDQVTVVHPEGTNLAHLMWPSGLDPDSSVR